MTLASMAPLRRLLRLQPGEGARTLLLLAQNFCVVAITIAGKAARDTFFLSRFDKSYLPLMYVACAFVVAFAAAAFARMARRSTPASMLNGSCALFVAGVLVLGARVRGAAIPALYVWVEIVISLSALQFWLMASEMFDPRQAKRLFGIVGGGGALASIVVGTAVRPFVDAFGPTALLGFAAVAVAGFWVLGRAALRQVAVRHRPAHAERRAPQPARLDDYLLTVAVIVGLSAVVSQVIDYQFKIIASRSFAGEAELAGFFGHFYALTGVASLIVQFLLTSRILAQFGLAAGLMVLPACLNVGTLAVLIRPQLWSGALAKFSDQTIKHTLNNSALELLWLPVPAEKRTVMRPTISGTYKSFSEAGAGIVTYGLAKVVALQYLGLLSLVALLGWFAAVRRIKGLYSRELVAAIERRQIDFDDLVIDAQDAEMVSIIDRALHGGDEAGRLFALELIEGLPLEPWAASLRRLAESGSDAVRARIIGLAADEPAVLDDDAIVAAIARPGAAAAEAIRVAGVRRLPEAMPQLGLWMASPDATVRAAAAVAALRIDPQATERPRIVLAELLAQPATRALAIDQLADDLALLPGAQLRALLSDVSPDVRRAAFQAAAARRDASCVPGIVVGLEDVRVAPAARAALRAFPEEGVLAEIARAYPDRGIAVLRTLAEYSSDDAIALLLDAVDASEPDVIAQAAQAIGTIARRRPLPAYALRRADEAAARLVRRAYIWNRLLLLLPDEAGSLLLRDHWEDRIHGTIPAIIRLKLLAKPGDHVETAIRIVRSADLSRLPFVLELLEGVVQRDQVEPWLGLLEPVPVEGRDAIGRRRFPDLPQDLTAELRCLVDAGTDWERAIGLHYLGSDGRRPQLRSSTDMLSVLEKTILLKSVTLFRDIPAEKLSRVAQIAEETRWAAGDAIVREGEAGDALHIVVEGRIRVHKGGRDLAVLTKGECVGEMALLDQAPRSADVTVLEDSTLLRIALEDFQDVLSANPPILQGILRLLTRRLRDANDELAARS